jgi:peptide chain release factor 1
MFGTDTMFDKLASIRKRYEELGEQMADPEVAGDYERVQKLAREHSQLGEIVRIGDEYTKLKDSISQAHAIVDEGSDAEFVALAREEIAAAESRIAELEVKLRRALIPKGPYDDKDVIVEIRAAAGGDEAGLFAGDLFRMYSRYAERHGWAVEIMDSHASDLGGFKAIVFEVSGQGAYSRLKYESGAHRVQRVPETEAQGRIHTSTATVAVLPEADEIDLHINANDLRIDTYNAGGAGGQNVQKNDNAVRITHIPTGIVATCQDERSQLKNRNKAMAVLRARLLDVQQRKQREEIDSTRKSQVGTGDRAEKIRTYNFPQDRMTDHRPPYTRHNLPTLLDGDLDDVIDALQQMEQAEILEAQLA